VAVATADPATAYARKVVAGKIVVGRLVRLACERHLADLKTGHKRGLRFDRVEAQAAIDFWAMCPHLKGRKWSGQGIVLEPWQAFIIALVYGWKRADGRRRFRVVWIEMGRKNGKSTLAYPAALHNLTVDGEPGAEVYSCATKKDQAKIVYDMARRAVIRTPELLEVLTPYVHSVVNEETWAKLEALGADADTLDGLNPSCVICDEVHKWKGRELWDVIDTATGAREQPLIWVVTTAGPEGEESVYGQEHGYTRQVLEGVVEDDSRFGYIACLDADDDWKDPKNFVKANPNLGVSVQADEIAGAVEKAKHSPSSANAVKRLRLGIRTQDADAWIPLTLWDSLRDSRVSMEKLKGFPCWGGLDLASESDFAALSLLFPLDEVAGELVPAADSTKPDIYGLVHRLWMPPEARYERERKLREIVKPWMHAGHVVAHQGDSIDQDAIEAEVLRIAEEYDLMCLAYDPFNAGMLAQHLAANGVNVWKFVQSMNSFAPAVKRFDELLSNKRIRHDGNPCVRWMADNVVLVQSGAGARMPSRKKSRNKIDGIVSSVESVGASMSSEGQSTASYYDTKGVETA
jgi:phage terminase large subunit-like protein